MGAIPEPPKLAPLPPLLASVQRRAVPFNMHRLWSIPEIVSFILDFLRLSDQARMAQVSRHIWERSVPFVWRDLPDIYMLVEPFPPEKQPIAEGTKRQQVSSTPLL